MHKLIAWFKFTAHRPIDRWPIYYNPFIAFAFTSKKRQGIPVQVLVLVFQRKTLDNTFCKLHYVYNIRWSLYILLVIYLTLHAVCSEAQQNTLYSIWLVSMRYYINFYLILKFLFLFVRSSNCRWNIVVLELSSCWSLPTLPRTFSVYRKLWQWGNAWLYHFVIEQFSFECRKIKTMIGFGLAAD